MMDKQNIPLAHRIRPKSLEDFFGQEHILGEEKPLRKIIENNILISMILWGPPGCGKTTIAKIISKKTNSDFFEFSAVNAGKNDIEKAINNSILFNKRTIVFLDEIHRFNKAQQDYLLPYVEKGIITLIGATTENPSFEIIPALLSRTSVFILESLKEEDLIKILERAITKDPYLKELQININEEDKKLMANISNGDARFLLNLIETIVLMNKDKKPLVINKELIFNSAQKILRYDKKGEEHYNIISALHKSMRDSDIDASVYWVMRMIEAGEDPKYIIRRMIRFASEDVGNADPNALILAISAKQAIEFLGYPECDTILVQVAAYLANTKKSNSSYEATLKAREEIKKSGNLPVPFYLRNPETKFMKEIGYGENYKYFHNDESAKNQEHFPKGIKNKRFYNIEKDK